VGLREEKERVVSRKMQRLKKIKKKIYLKRRKHYRK
jgi:hypothetical protein